MTPNAARVRDELLAKWGAQISHIGVTNCRRIAGSSTWSQHAWSNALDIHTSDDTGSIIAAVLRNDPNSKTVLWHVPGHFDHVHVDFWPTGHGTPPCAGGVLRVRHADGRIDQDWTPDYQEDEMVKTGDRGPHVKRWQDWLIQLNALAKGEDDGIFGAKTEAAVKKIQQRPDVALDPTGIIDLTTGSVIVERLDNLRMTRHAKTPHAGEHEHPHRHSFEVPAVLGQTGEVNDD